MAYKYYCTVCGKELNQETVLFDMQTVLTGESARFNILKFRLTLAELQALVDSGTASKDRDGYKICAMPLQTLMKYVANENNLNDPVVASLTMEDIQSYLSSGLTLDNPIETTAAAPKKKSIFDDDDDDEADDIPAAQPMQQSDEKPLSPALQALEAKSSKIEDSALTKNTLREDLSILRNIFSLSPVYAFQICLISEPDNEGRPVIYSYTCVNLQTHEALQPDNVRVCPSCSEPLFQHAGTAQHQAIAFIGDQKAGKTSLILALSYYAQNGLQVNLGDMICSNCDRIESVADIVLLTRTPRFISDLSHYREGVAPPKTDSTKRAYSATFWIKNKYEHNKHYILTLTDLPGELCQEGGFVDKAKVQNMFNVALSCDAYVLCFDSTTAQTGYRAAAMIQDVCNWADEFQKMRAVHTNAKGYAPMMIAFTKDHDLEAEDGLEYRNRAFMDPVQRVYMFNQEREIIEKDNVFSFVREKLKETGQLNTAYQASLRCSPYGFAAPGAEAVAKDPSLNQDLNGDVRHPRPKHVDQLMKWLLMVSGSIPTEGVFYPTLGDTAACVKYDGNFVKRSQMRKELPQGEGKDGPCHEAMSRCYLFENPGEVDVEYVKRCNEPARLLALKMSISLGKKQ